MTTSTATVAAPFCAKSGGDCTCALCTCPSVLTAALSEAESISLSAGFAALADPVRLRLVSLLADAADGSGCVCDLIAPLGRSQATVSHHLKVLADAGLVTGRKHGRLISYRLVDKHLAALRAAITKEHPHE